MNKPKIFLDITRGVLNLVESAFRGSIRSDGQEMLPPGPRLFLANHFTRFETVMLPYLVDKFTGRYPHTLADVGLFKGPLQIYFRNMGVVSTGAPDRDTQIIRDLLTGNHDWVVYPEGRMMKTRQVVRGRTLMLHSPQRVGPPHTGAAVWALKAEVYRRMYFKALADHDQETLDELRARFGLEPGEVSELSVQVVPVTLSFYPLRAGENVLVRVLRRAIGHVPYRSREELEIEGNLALGKTHIDVHFGQAEGAYDFLGRYRTWSRFLPFLRDVEKRNPLLSGAASTLTQTCMQRVYDNLEVNLDHVVAGLLRAWDRPTIRERQLRRAIYLAAHSLGRDPRIRLHPDLQADLAPRIYGGRWPELASILRMGQRQGVLKLKHGIIGIRRKKLEWLPRFHAARLQNTLHVLANEAASQGLVMPKLREIAAKTRAEIRLATVDALVAADDARFEGEYAAACEEAGVCLNPETGKPIFLRGSGDVGVVLSHGFLSSPAEVRPLAEYLHRQGLTVYVPRLAGHGTRPAHLATVNMEDWLAAYETAYAVVRQSCRHVVLGGFSTGGLLALAASARFPARAVFAINPPIFMRHIGALAAPFVNIWNRLLTLLHVTRGRYERIDSHPEYPEHNYNAIYVHALVQLQRLMALVRGGLPNIRIPTLILQGDHDPVVNPKSAHWIHDALTTPDKLLEKVSSDRHVMVLGAGADRVYDRVARFILSLHPPTHMPAVHDIIPAVVPADPPAPGAATAAAYAAHPIDQKSA